MQKYVLGFLFNEDVSNVVLVEKLRPLWIRNRFIGLGGKVELDETYEQAMKRECTEESGLELDNWKQFAVFSGKQFEIGLFYVIGEPEKAKTMTDEKIIVASVVELISTYGGKYDLMPDVRWMIPM